MRLDAYLYKIGKYVSRNKASEAVKRGEVKVNGKTVTKISHEISDGAIVEINDADNFVSLGGYKLEKAISDFSLDISGKVFADIGASTGGFTDCLLRNGADTVYAVDVGENQLAESIKNDNRVVIMDNRNARELSEKDFPTLLDGVVCDVSFISLTYILKPICDILLGDGYAVTLIKPQFECGKNALNGQGIVKDKRERLSAIKKIYDFGEKIGLIPVDVTTAPIKENKNVEYLMLFKKRGEKFKKEDIEKKVIL